MSNTSINVPRAFNIAEAARYAHVSRGTIESWIHKNLIAYEELPNTGKGIHKFRLIRKADLDAFLDKCYHATPVPTKQNKTKTLNESEIFLMPK